MRPARIAGAAAIVASALVVSAAGVGLGSVIRDHREIGANPAEVRQLETIDAPQLPTGKVDPQRGPNVADLGGGR